MVPYEMIIILYDIYVSSKIIKLFLLYYAIVSYIELQSEFILSLIICLFILVNEVSVIFTFEMYTIQIVSKEYLPNCFLCNTFHININANNIPQ